MNLSHDQFLTTLLFFITIGNMWTFHLIHDDNLFCPYDSAQPVRHDKACPFFARTFNRALDMSENSKVTQCIQISHQWNVIL